jgi:2-polyprenyl-6-methoxyphenol hydroxylase-like FAD-dependent oxidoreductase
MRIVIVGAGIGGLTLAAALRREGMEARVYEREPSSTARPQGYAISLKGSTGLRVLRELGLEEELRKTGRPTPDFTFLTPEGRPLLHLHPAADSPEYTVGISREILRARLLEAVPRDWLTWGARCSGVTRRGDTLIVEFEEGPPVEADLVVAADGVRSALRKKLVGDPPHYLGLAAIGGVTGGEIEHPLLAGGAFMSLGRGSSLFVQRYSAEGKTIWSFCTHAREGQFDPLEGQCLRDWTLDQIRTWHEPIPALVSSTAPSDVTVRSYYDRAPLRTYVYEGIVLMGDAGHPMSPFQGQGANMAMVDALELARHLKMRLQGDQQALARYDRQAVKRNRTEVMRSRIAARLFHSRGRLSLVVRNAGLRLMDQALLRSRPKR